MEKNGATSLHGVEIYASNNNIKLPKFPQGQAFIDATKKALAIFKDEKDPEVPLVIYVSRIVDRESITYDSSIEPVPPPEKVMESP